MLALQRISQLSLASAISAKLSGNPFSVLWGFKDHTLESEYQACLAEDAKQTDLTFNACSFLLMSYVSWQLCSAGADSDIGVVFYGSLVIHAIWAWVTTWPKSRKKAQFRTWILLSMRIHNVICGTICDRFLLYPYMREATLVFLFRNLLTASRAVVLSMLTLGMRIPFKYHVPMQLIATACYTRLNQRLCSECSQPMQDNFSRIAQAMSRMAGASTLLRPQSNLPSIQDRHACLAVNGILLMAVATLLPSAVLCFWETKSRTEFLRMHAGEEGSESSAANSTSSSQGLSEDEELCEAAGLPLFPVVVAVAALPACSMLWNLYIVVDKLLMS